MAERYFTPDLQYSTESKTRVKSLAHPVLVKAREVMANKSLLCRNADLKMRFPHLFTSSYSGLVFDAQFRETTHRPTDYLQHDDDKYQIDGRVWLTGEDSRGLQAATCYFLTPAGIFVADSVTAPENVVDIKIPHVGREITLSTNYWTMGEPHRVQHYYTRKDTGEKSVHPNRRNFDNIFSLEPQKQIFNMDQLVEQDTVR